MDDSDQQYSQSGALIGSNDDLLTQIFLWLPVISILWFKSVSKRCRSLLSHTTFTLRYDAIHFLPKPLGLFTNGDLYVPFDDEDPTTPPFRNLDFFHDPNGIRILQSFNGLLFCSSYYGDIYDHKFYVFNPTTKQFAIIPSVPGGKAVQNSIRFMGLAFHQTDCVHYKAVCILTLEDRQPVWDDDEEELFQIQTYSSETREWKISIESFSAHNPIFGSGVYWNRAIHWILSDGSCMYFKIDVEHLQSLPLPVETQKRYLGESRGHLHTIVRNHHQSNRLQLKVYEMLMDHSGWFVKYHVQLDAPGAFLDMIHPSISVDFIDVVRGEIDEDSFIVLLINEELITYNVHGNNTKKIFKFDVDYEGKHLYYKYFLRYAQTLASF